MIRNLIRFLILIAVVAFVRYLIGMITRAVSGAIKGEAETAETAETAESTGARQSKDQGELLRDPVCGVYVAEQTSIKKAIGGETVHFCSTACRDKYPVS